MWLATVSLGDIRKSLKYIDSNAYISQAALDADLTRSFFTWIVESKFDLSDALSASQTWSGSDEVKIKYVKRFVAGELNGFVKIQSWAEQMEEEDDFGRNL